MIAAELSDRYITDRFLPDKAIDLVDEACSGMRVQLDSVPEDIDRLQRRVISLQVRDHEVCTRKGHASMLNKSSHHLNSQ